ncbi:MAG: DUF2339 domain-containing protein, partial [Spirochaetia bacterium]|nr:DUF2339 domain-containing protein [Spirochaetia bacterium]
LNALKGGAVSPSALEQEAKKPVTTQAASGGGRDFNHFEFLLAGNLLGKLGLLALVLATAWFIKLAFDEQWINESGRIYTGLISGFLVTAGGLYLAHKSYRILPLAIIGAGSAILYISIWGAYHYYDLIGFQEAFVFLVIMSIITAALAYGGQSQVLYAFSLLGSMLAPVLLSHGENSYRFLFSYLTLVNAGFLVLSARYSWRVVPWLLFISNVILFSIWGEEHLAHSSFTVPYLYVMAFFLMFSVRQLFLAPRTSHAFRLDEAILFVLTGIFASAASFWLLDAHHRPLRPHGWLVIAGCAAAFFVAVDRMLVRRKEPLPRPTELLLCSSVLVLFVPVLFAAVTDFTDGSIRTASWIAFAGILSVTAAAQKSRIILAVALVAWLPAFFRLFLMEDRPDYFLPVWNGRFAMHVMAAALLGAAYAVQRKAPLHTWMRGFVYAAMITFILGALRDNHDYISDPHYRNLGYSYVLAVHAVVFLAAGFSLSLVSWRRAGLALAAIVVLKLYAYDIWTMGRAVRIIAGFSLGAGLVGMSILYHRFRGKIFPEEKQS